jgi:hypothetical protein
MKRIREIYSNNGSVDEQTSPFGVLAADVVRLIANFLPVQDLAPLARACKWFAYTLMESNQGRLYVPASWKKVLWTRVAHELGERHIAASIVRHFLVHDLKVHLLNGLDGAHRYMNVRVEFKSPILTIHVGDDCIFVYKRCLLPDPHLQQADFVTSPLSPFRAYFIKGPDPKSIQTLKDRVRVLHRASLENNKISRAVPADLRAEAGRLKRERKRLRQALDKHAQTMKTYSAARFYQLPDFIAAAEAFVSFGNRHLALEEKLDSVKSDIDKIKDEIKNNKTQPS